jgi:hypothetical protein
MGLISNFVPLYIEQKAHRFQGHPRVTLRRRLLASLGGRKGGKSYSLLLNPNLPIVINNLG